MFKISTEIDSFISLMVIFSLLKHNMLLYIISMWELKYYVVYFVFGSSQHNFVIYHIDFWLINFCCFLIDWFSYGSRFMIMKQV